MQVRNTNHYADQVAVRYPLLDLLVVRELCQWMMRRFYVLVSQGEEILIHAGRGPHPVRLKIYHREFYVERANLRNREKLLQMKHRRQQRQSRQRQARYRAHYGLPRQATAFTDSSCEE